MSRAVLSLGSNVGDRRAHLQQAVASLGKSGQGRLPDLPHAALGPVPQDDFYNIAVIVEDDTVDAQGWLARCQAAGAGRRPGTVGALGTADAGRGRDHRRGAPPTGRQ